MLPVWSSEMGFPSGPVMVGGSLPGTVVAGTFPGGGDGRRGRGRGRRWRRWRSRYGAFGVTSTGKLFDVEFPLESVAVQSTVVVPTGKVEPEAGLQDVDGEGSAASLAVAL